MGSETVQLWKLGKLVSPLSLPCSKQDRNRCIADRPNGVGLYELRKLVRMRKPKRVCQPDGDDR